MERPSKINAGESVTICFVDFGDIVSATEAMHALQVGLSCFSLPPDSTKLTCRKNVHSCARCIAGRRCDASCRRRYRLELTTTRIIFKLLNLNPAAAYLFYSACWAAQ